MVRTRLARFPAPQDYDQRAAQIVALRWEGETLDSIGRVFGVSRERVRVILEKQQTLGLAIPTYYEVREIRARAKT